VHIAPEVDAMLDKRTAAAIPTSVSYIQDDAASHPAMSHVSERTGKLERYRIAEPGEDRSGAHMIISTFFRHPEPFSWPSVVKLRKKPKVVDTQSSAGYLRKEALLHRIERNQMRTRDPFQLKRRSEM
jgi:hypothetical protein